MGTGRTSAIAGSLVAAGALAAAVAHVVAHQPHPPPVDALVPASGAPAPARVVVLDDDARAFSYSGAWEHTRGRTDRYHGTSTFSASPGATALVIFTGTRVAVDAIAQPAGGIADIVIDDQQPPQAVDFYAAASGRRTVYVSRGLAAGQHTLAIVVTARRNPRSSGSIVSIDDVRVAIPLSGMPQGRSAA